MVQLLGPGLNASVFLPGGKPWTNYQACRSAGFGWLRIFPTFGSDDPKLIAQQVQVGQAAGLKMVVAPGIWKGNDADLLVKQWGQILKLCRPDVIDLLAEPHDNWPDETFRQQVQPELYAKIRALAPQTTIILSPGGFAGSEMFAPYEAAGKGKTMWLPADKSNVLVGCHEYHYNPGGGDDAFNMDQLAVWQAQQGVKVIISEFDGSGGGTFKPNWDTYLRVVAAKQTLYARHGFGSALWMDHQVFDSAGVIRPDLLLALRSSSYAPPLDPTIVSGSGAAGSSPVAVQAS